MSVLNSLNKNPINRELLQSINYQEKYDENLKIFNEDRTYKTLLEEKKFLDAEARKEKIMNQGYCDVVMPYSFLMGMFNYLSSFFHAASQLYFSSKISPRLEVESTFLAHSDDSAGVLSSANIKLNLKAFKVYHHFQKSINHILSSKKSNLSEDMFEIISILYKNGELIPLTHKFISNLSYTKSNREVNSPSSSWWYNYIKHNKLHNFRDEGSRDD